MPKKNRCQHAIHGRTDDHVAVVHNAMLAEGRSMTSAEISRRTGFYYSVVMDAINTLSLDGRVGMELNANNELLVPRRYTVIVDTSRDRSPTEPKE